MKIFKTAFLFTVFICYAYVYSFAQNKSDTAKLIYVPVYSSIYHGDRENEFDLTITVTIRNLDSKESITLYSVDYYNSAGNPVRNYLNAPRVLKPFETVNFIVRESDTHGGSSSGFLVRWNADKKVTDLFVEAVMIGTKQQQGISFTSRGVHIK